MAEPIDFYFEFSSPFGYMGAHLIEGVAAKYGREVNWRPFLLGAVFKAEGTQSLVSYPMKGPYSKRDIERSAKYHGISFTWPPSFPIFTVNAARAVYWQQDQDPEAAKGLALSIYDQAFREGRDIADSAVLADAATAAGIDAEAMLGAIKSPEVKQRLKDETAAAIDRKVFGSPFFIVDGEPFWGVDRLPQLERWLETGGW